MSPNFQHRQGIISETFLFTYRLDVYHWSFPSDLSLIIYKIPTKQLDIKITSIISKSCYNISLHPRIWSQGAIIRTSCKDIVYTNDFKEYKQFWIFGIFSIPLIWKLTRKINTIELTIRILFIPLIWKITRKISTTELTVRILFIPLASMDINCWIYGGYVFYTNYLKTYQAKQNKHSWT